MPEELRKNSVLFSVVTAFPRENSVLFSSAMEE